MTSEEALDIVLEQFRRSGVRPGQILMQGAIEADFLRPAGRQVADLEAGVNLGIDRGLLEIAGLAVRLKRLPDAG